MPLGWGALLVGQLQGFTCSGPWGCPDREQTRQRLVFTTALPPGRHHRLWPISHLDLEDGSVPLVYTPEALGTGPGRVGSKQPGTARRPAPVEEETEQHRCCKYLDLDGREWGVELRITPSVV